MTTSGSSRDPSTSSTFAVERLDGADHLDRSVPDGVDDIHVDQRRHLVETGHPGVHALFGNRQPEFAEVAEIRPT